MEEVSVLHMRKNKGGYPQIKRPKLLELMLTQYVGAPDSYFTDPVRSC